jgi:hypothetical protein
VAEARFAGRVGDLARIIRAGAPYGEGTGISVQSLATTSHYELAVDYKQPGGSGIVGIDIQQILSGAPQRASIRAYETSEDGQIAIVLNPRRLQEIVATVGLASLHSQRTRSA